MIRQVCMFCGLDLGSVEGPSGRGPGLSHGICADCLPRLLAGKGKGFQDFLDSIKVPVLLVDHDSRVLAGNRLAADTFRVDFGAAQNQGFGEVFECEHSRRPGGCGRTEHCKSCTVRIAVTETAETGRPCLGRTAFRDLGDLADDTTPRFLVSTWKVGDVVLLRVEDLSGASGIP